MEVEANVYQFSEKLCLKQTMHLESREIFHVLSTFHFKPMQSTGITSDQAAHISIAAC